MKPPGACTEAQQWSIHYPQVLLALLLLLCAQYGTTIHCLLISSLAELSEMRNLQVNERRNYVELSVIS